ncbi:hypothetical protein V6N13_064934 [Hibiscus sabdariffa]
MMFWCIRYRYTRKRIGTCSSKTSRCNFCTRRTGTGGWSTGTVCNSYRYGGWSIGTVCNSYRYDGWSIGTVCNSYRYGGWSIGTARIVSVLKTVSELKNVFGTYSIGTLCTVPVL